MYQFTKEELKALLSQAIGRYRDHYICGPTEGNSSLAYRKAIIDVMDQAEAYQVEDYWEEDGKERIPLTEEEMAKIEVPF